MSMPHDTIKHTEEPITDDATSDDRGETLRVRSNLRAGTVLSCTPVTESAVATPAASATVTPATTA